MYKTISSKNIGFWKIFKLKQAYVLAADGHDGNRFQVNWKV